MSDTDTTDAVKSTPASRSRSRSRSQRPNYKIDDVGLNKSDEDEEYKEEDEVEEEDEEEEEGTKIRNGKRTTDNVEEYMEEEEEEEHLPRRRSKRTHSKIKEEEEELKELKGRKRRNVSTTVRKENIEGNENANANANENDSGAETPKDTKTPGEKTNNQNNEDSHLNKKMKLSYPVDPDGHPLPVINDEYALPDDPSGEEKIDIDGNLKGGRKFKVRTFKLFDNGDRLFMLATEPARAVGLRDSATLFQHHPNLYKYILSQSEKNKLIGQSVLPYSYRNRTISVVAARSVFKEFGHQIIVNGKENDDDYYSDPNLRHNIVKEGQVPRDKQSYRSKKSKTAKYKHGKSSQNNNNDNVTTDTTNKHRRTERQDYIDQAQIQLSTDPAKNTVEFFQNSQSHSTNIVSNANGTTNTAPTHGTNTHNTIDVNINSNYNALFNMNGSQLNATNWLYQHAAACSRYNSDIYYDRVRILLIENQGIRDPYTNTLHIPQGTQATKVIRYQKVNNLKKMNGGTSNNKEVQYEVLIEDKDLLRPITGLSKIPKEIYEDVVDRKTLEAIEQQRLFEGGL